MKRILLKLAILMLFAVPAISANATANKDFKVKGFHLDMRIQVMKPEALKKFALELSKSGINTLIMEYEATFPFEKHPLIANRYAYTKAELSDFIKYCNGINIDVIPLQQSFGHVEYILRHDRYSELREDKKDYSQVNPLEEEKARQLFTDLFTELEEIHTSKYVHIGCDETRLLGKGAQSKAKIEKEGIGKLYGDYVAMICDVVIKMGKIPVLWADIALKYPESLKYLPKSTIFVDWNYGWALDNFGNHAQLMKSGFEIWGAPALRSFPDNYNLSTWQKHLDNIRDFIPQGRTLGYTGMVMTSWSTSGVYSYHNENEADIIDLYAIRRVYPLTGFNLLLKAFNDGLQSASPLDMTSFINQYGKERYGFNEQQSHQLWTALTRIPYQVRNGRAVGTNLSIRQMVDSAAISAKILANLKPSKNHNDLEHYRLMANTRWLYLAFKDLENQANSNDFDNKENQVLLMKLKELINYGEKLNRKYIKINKAVFYTSELKVDNELRIIKIKLLYERLARKR
jgi:hexosaminidase